MYIFYRRFYVVFQVLYLNEQSCPPSREVQDKQQAYCIQTVPIWRLLLLIVHARYNQLSVHNYFPENTSYQDIGASSFWSSERILIHDSTLMLAPYIQQVRLKKPD